MRFLALTQLQSVLLAVVTITAILALYFLKHKRRQLIISSTLLWRRVIENRLENSIFEKLRRFVSILIAVVTGLLIAMAIARPEVDLLTGAARRSLIVMDTSPSMRARTSDGRTRWQHATERAIELMTEAAPSTRFRISDTAGQFDLPYTADRSELERAIGRMHPVSASVRFPDVDEGQETYFITDGVAPLTIPPATNLLSVFEAAPNVGITAFEIRSMPSAVLAYEAYLEVENFGTSARDLEIHVSGAGQQRITRRTRLDAGQSHRQALDLSQFEGGGIRAAVAADGDALTVDDVAYAYLPVKRRTKTLLVTRGHKLIETVLKLDRLVDLTVIDPKQYASDEDFDAVVFDSFVPAKTPSRPALLLGFRPAPWLRRPVGTVERPVFESVTDDHPALQAVALHDVSIARVTRIDPSNLSVLATAAGKTPLIVASERPRWIMLTFDLRDSDFPYHSGFPLFIDNAMAWLSRERLALRRSPGIVDVPIAAAQIRTIDGRPVASNNYAGSTTFEADEPGLYVATQANGRQYVAVNFADSRHSDINNSRVKETTKGQLRGGVLSRELWFYMVFAALLLVLVEWFTYHRGITL